MTDWAGTGAALPSARNLYADIAGLKTAIGIASSVTTYDVLLSLYSDAASRRVDAVAHRRFYTETDTRRFRITRHSDRMPIDDLLSASAVTGDTDGDETYTETWTAGTDYVLEPQHRFPKLEIRLHLDGSKTFGADRNYLRIAGVFGFGDGLSATPWAATTLTGTVATAAGTTLAVTAAGLTAGQTILLGAEQMQVTAVDGVNATVVRGVNGTTAAAHAAEAISTAVYPAPVITATYALVGEMWNHRTMQGLRSVMAGNYQEMAKDAMKDDVIARILGARLRRLDR